MTERTNEELADSVGALANEPANGLQEPERKLLDEAVRRLREMDGKRIEGWAWPTDLVDKEAFDNGNLEAKWLSFELWKNREELVEAVRATGDTIHHVTVIFSKDPIMDMVDRDMDKRADVFKRLTNGPEKNDE